MAKMKMVPFNIPEDMKSVYVHDAHQHDMNLSEYIRWLLNQEHERMMNIKG